MLSFSFCYTCNGHADRLAAGDFVAANKDDLPELFSSKKIPLTSILASSIIIYLI